VRTHTTKHDDTEIPKSEKTAFGIAKHAGALLIIIRAPKVPCTDGTSCITEGSSKPSFWTHILSIDAGYTPTY